MKKKQRKEHIMLRVAVIMFIATVYGIAARNYPVVIICFFTATIWFLNRRYDLLDKIKKAANKRKNRR